MKAPSAAEARRSKRVRRDPQARIEGIEARGAFTLFNQLGFGAVVAQAYERLARPRRAPGA